MKYTEEIKDRVFDLWSEGGWTQKQICQMIGVTEDTFIRWKNNKKEFSELIKRAEQEKFNNLRALAESGLQKLLNGYEVTETKKERKMVDDGDGNKVAKMVVTEEKTKHFLPNVAAVIHTLNNRDAHNWQDRRNVDVTSGGDKIQTFRIGDQEIEF